MTAKRRARPTNSQTLPKSVVKIVSSSSYRSLNFPHGCSFSFRILPPTVYRVHHPCPEYLKKDLFCLYSRCLLISGSPHHPIFILPLSPNPPISLSFFSTPARFLPSQKAHRA